MTTTWVSYQICGQAPNIQKPLVWGKARDWAYLPHHHGILVGSFAALLSEDAGIATGTVRKHAARNHSQESIGFPLRAQILQHLLLRLYPILQFILHHGSWSAATHFFPFTLKARCPPAISFVLSGFSHFPCKSTILCFDLGRAHPHSANQAKPSIARPLYRGGREKIK